LEGFFGRVPAVCAAVLALMMLAAPAFAAEKEKTGDESMELRDSLASFYGPRSAPATRIAPRAFAAAASIGDAVPSVDTTPWQELGPYAYFPDNRDYIDPVWSNSGSGSGFNSGRITGVAVAPNGDLYAAGAGGGIWRSVDAAHQQWTPVFDNQPTTAEGAVAVVASGDNYTVYAGTGEPTINLDSYAGIGVMASDDHGDTWHRVGGSELNGAAIFKIVPAPHGVLYAATSHGLYRMGPSDSTWQQVIGDPDTNTGTPNAQVLNLVSDVAVRPGSDGTEVVAVRGWRAGATTNGLYVSTDSGHSFRGPLQPQGYVPQKAQGRGSIAYSHDGKKLYVMVEDPVAFANGGGGTQLEGIYLSTHDVKGPFTQIASPSVLMNSGSAQKPGAIGTGYKPGVQAWYNQFLTVDPASSNHVYVGLEEVYETTDAGKTWVAAAPYWNLTLKCFNLMATNFGGCPDTTHSDQHAAAIADGTLYVGNDGGVFSRPTNVSTAGDGWTDHNRNLGTLQYYYADSGTDAQHRTVFWGGLQDNGTSKLIEGADKLNPSESSQPFGGDGGAAIVDTANADNVLTEYTDLAAAITNDGGRHWRDAAPPDPLPLFIAPIQQDETTASNLYAGGEKLWQSTDGFNSTDESWTSLIDTGAGHSISALDLAGGHGYAAWCGPCWPGYESETGFDRGIVTDSGGTWQQLDLSKAPAGCDPVPNRYIAGVAVDPGDTDHAYIALSGYARHWMVGPDDPGVGHVYETSDGGTCWHDISGDLVDAPANDVAIVGSRLVVANDVGVFTSGLDGGSWLRVGNGLPHTIVADLNTTPDGRLLAATHGRGLWAIPTSALG
jgi:photosystem II stability/assembly factor-like uncharacterized protein